MLLWAKEHGQEIAKRMLDEVNKHRRLIQNIAALLIRILFGSTYVYRSKNHSWAIQKPILDEFRKLTGDDDAWSRSRQLWCLRRHTDPLDTRMVR